MFKSKLIKDQRLNVIKEAWNMVCGVLSISNRIISNLRNNVTKVCYVTEQSVLGLSYPDEDSYLT